MRSSRNNDFPARSHPFGSRGGHAATVMALLPVFAVDENGDLGLQGYAKDWGMRGTSRNVAPIRSLTAVCGRGSSGTMSVGKEARRLGAGRGSGQLRSGGSGAAAGRAGVACWQKTLAPREFRFPQGKWQ